MDRFFDCLRLLAAICLLLDSLIKTSLGLIPLTAKYEDMLFQFFNLKSASLSLQDASRAARIDTTTMPIGLITYMIVLPWSVLFFLNRCYLGNVVIHRHHTTTHDKGSFIYYVRNPLPPALYHHGLCQYCLDAVGSWQIILPTPNLERPY